MGLRDGEVARRAVVCGRVQGVGYRWNCAREAERLGVRGWARNEPDGSVDVLAVGARDAVDALLDWCRRGPRHAEVSDVLVAEPDERERRDAAERRGFTTG